MTSLQLKIRSIGRDDADAWHDGAPMVQLVRDAVGRGRTPLVGVVLRAERVDLVDLGEAYKQGVPTHRLLAGLSRSTVEGGGQVEAVGVMGVVQARRGQAEPAVPLAVAFLEWEDCRWWSWRGLLDANASMILADTELYASAEQGDPLPATFGRWWSMGRRVGSDMHLSKAAPRPELVN